MTKEIIEILENLLYWETCPDDYKETIKKYLSSEPLKQVLNLDVVSGSLPVPKEIWVNIYNPIKPNSWDIHTTEKAAVVNSIGAPTHRYIHESLCGNDR